MIQKIIFLCLLVLSSLSYAKKLTQTDLNIAVKQHFDIVPKFFQKSHLTVFFVKAYYYGLTHCCLCAFFVLPSVPFPLSFSLHHASSDTL